MNIRKYKPEDEKQWIQSRVLSFLDTSYYDSVYNSKEKYKNPSIELVAEANGKIIGLLDIEMNTDTDMKKVCSKDSILSGMIWHIAVHPDFRRKGIGSELLRHAELSCRDMGILRIEAWTRDDTWVRDWYYKQGFNIGYSYLHINFDHGEMNGLIESKLSGIVPVKMFAHFVSDNIEEKERIKKSFNV